MSHFGPGIMVHPQSSAARLKIFKRKGPRGKRKSNFNLAQWKGQKVYVSKIIVLLGK